MNLHTVLNLGIALSYYWIPIILALMLFSVWRAMPSFFRVTIAAFALFICACGTGHWQMAWSHDRETLLQAHAVTLAVSAPVALAMPLIANGLRSHLVSSQKLTKDLQHSESMFNAFLDNHPKLLAWIKDEQLVNTYSNQSLIQTFGTQPVGRLDSDWLPAASVEAMNVNDRRVLETGIPCEVVEYAPTPDGVNHSWLSYKFRFEVDGQRFTGGTATNITEQEHLRRDMELAFCELEQFTHAASHDLKTPLRGMSGLLTILERRLDRKLTEADRALFLQVQRDCRYAIDLVDGILTYSRLGQAQTRRTKVDIGELLAQVCSRFTERLITMQASVRWFPEAMPLLSVDATQIQQVFENLIDNALKYRSTAPPEITIELKHQAGQWVFSVADNGLGVDPAMRDQLFVMFSRLHGRSEIEGTGIGLASVRKIAQRHGGDAWLESDGEGCGSTVYFSIGPESEKNSFPVSRG